MPGGHAPGILFRFIPDLELIPSEKQQLPFTDSHKPCNRAHNRPRRNPMRRR